MVIQNNVMTKRNSNYKYGIQAETREENLRFLIK